MILYELLTGRTPFRGSGLAVAGQVLTQEPLPLSEHRADVDPRLEVICRKAMAKKSAERYISMSALARALTDFLQAPADVGSSDSIEGPIAARTEASPSRVDPASQVDSHPEGGEPEGESIWPRGRNRLIVASAGLVALALVGYVVYSRTHPGSGFSVKSPDGDEASRTANLSGGSSSARSESAGINSDRIAWTNGEGEWSIRADELTVRYPGSGRRQAFLWFGKPSGPAVFSFQVMHDRPGGWVSAQMRMRGAASDFLQLAFGGVNPSLSFQNWTNGKREGRPNNNPDDIQPGFALTPGRWYSVVVEIFGRQTNVKIDGKHLIKCFADEYAMTGYVGFGCGIENGTPNMAHFRNIRVTGLRGELFWEGLPTLSKNETRKPSP